MCVKLGSLRTRTGTFLKLRARLLISCRQRHKQWKSTTRPSAPAHGRGLHSAFSQLAACAWQLTAVTALEAEAWCLRNLNAAGDRSFYAGALVAPRFEHSHPGAASPQLYGL